MPMQPPKGTKDILPKEYLIFQAIVNIARKTGEIYGYQSFEIPIFEHTEIFSRSLGNSSEIVNKEMYSFLDKKERNLTLRPEFTAGIVRSVISNGIYSNKPIKLFTSGPLFRYERPQKGRQRQFNQVNFESIGDNSPTSDAELISTAHDFIKNLKIPEVKLELNSLGDEKTRKNYTQALVEYFDKYKEELSYDSRIRLEKNPLRILDSKDDNDYKIIANSPKIKDFFSNEAKNYFDLLLENLSQLNIRYSLNDNLVRGLDYYTGTVFEFTTTKLGAQNALLAGGRYNQLFYNMSNGKQNIPAIGFAAGIERLMELQNLNILENRTTKIIYLEKTLDIESLKLAQKLRKSNIPTVIQYDNNPSKAIKKAVIDNTQYLIFLGSNEIKLGKFTIKDLDNKKEYHLDDMEIMHFIIKNRK